MKTLAAIPCAVAAYFVYEELTEDDAVIRTVGALELPPPNEVKLAQHENHLCFFALGDTGLASAAREAVVKQMRQQSKNISPHLIFLVGDNFYDAGVTSVNDSNWQTHFEVPFSAERFEAPFFACLGNHDYFGNVGAQIEYSTNHPRWNMPAPYYSFKKQIGNNATAEFFVLDTTPIEEGDYSTGSQIRWLQDKLQACRADWKIVVGHHPLYTGGEHGRSRRNYRHVAPLLDKFEVDLYICGHDHDLQLHDTQRGWLHLVTGAGSKLRSVRWMDTTLFAEATSGFARILLTPQRLTIEFFATDGLRFSHEMSKRAQLAAAGTAKHH